jgi:hypothetical protein
MSCNHLVELSPSVQECGAVDRAVSRRAIAPSSGMLPELHARRWVYRVRSVLVNTQTDRTHRFQKGADIIGDRNIMALRRSASAALVVLLLAAACGGGAGSSREAKPTARRTPSGPCAIARADIDGDGAVSILDLIRVSAHFGESVPPAPAALDQDGDGAITILDLNLVTSVFVRQVSDCP